MKEERANMAMMFEHGLTPCSKREPDGRFRPAVRITWEDGGKSHEETVTAEGGATFESVGEANDYAVDRLAKEWIDRRINPSAS